MPAPLYLFTGPEAGERNDAVETVRKNAERKYGPLDSHILYAADTGISEVVSLLQNGSLFAAARFVVLRNAELIKKKNDLETLTVWAKENSAPDAAGSVLVLVSEETAVDKKLENLVPKENRKIFWEMFEDRKEQWLRDFFRKNGYAVTPDAVELILELIENNTEALRSECMRFFGLFEKNYTVTADDVEHILSHNREESPFSLFAALADTAADQTGRFENSLFILQKICQSKQSNGVQIIAGLSWCFRRLLGWHRLHESGYPSDFDLKINGFSSKKMQAQYRGAAKIWNAAETARILALLAGTDTELRSGGQNQETVLLQTLLYAVCIKKGAGLAPYDPESD